MKKHVMGFVVSMAVLWPAMSVKAGQAYVIGCIYDMTMNHNHGLKKTTIRFNVKPTNSAKPVTFTFGQDGLIHGVHNIYLSPEDVAKRQYFLTTLQNAANLGQRVKINWYTSGTTKDIAPYFMVWPNSTCSWISQ